MDDTHTTTGADASATYEELLDRAVGIISATDPAPLNQYNEVDVRECYPLGYGSPHRWPLVGARHEAIKEIARKMEVSAYHGLGSLVVDGFEGFGNYGKITVKLIRGGRKAMEAIDKLSDQIKEEKKREKKAALAERPRDYSQETANPARIAKLLSTIS